MKNTEIQAYRFNPSASETAPDILQGTSPIQFLKCKYQRSMMFGLDNLKQTGCYKILGWRFDFRPYMKEFVVLQYGHWQSEWATNKTAIRNSTYGRIEKIVEVK